MTPQESAIGAQGSEITNQRSASAIPPRSGRPEGSPSAPPVAEARQHPRLKLPAMYTLVRVRPRGETRYRWTGYAYDVSASGLRFEMDEPLDAGAEVDVRVLLPGRQHLVFTALGHIVRLHDDDGVPGPVRMGMTFDHFPEPAERDRLHDYLADAGLPRIAA
jgi:PilZ domain